MTKHMMNYLSLVGVLCSLVGAQFHSDVQRASFQTLIEELKKELQLDSNSDSIKNLDKFDLSSIRLPQTADSNGKIAVLDQIGSLPVERGSFPVQRYPDGYQHQSPLLSAIFNRKTDSLNDDIGVAKRQGRWDFDYGLGGGRFGKRSRMFADYSLGGGRFGRDTSHVSEIDDVTDYEYNNED